MRPDVCCTGPRPCAGAGGRRWSIRVRNTFPLISGETSCADTQMQIFVCKNNLQFSWTSQVFPHMLMLVLTAVGVELPSHWAVSSLQSVWGHWSCDVRCQVPLQTTTMQWCHDAVWRFVIIRQRYGWWHVMPRLCRMHDSMWIISPADRGTVHWSSHQLVIDREIASLPRVEPGSTRSVWRLTDADKNTYVYIYPLEAEIKSVVLFKGPCQLYRSVTNHPNLDIKLLNLFVKRTTIMNNSVINAWQLGTVPKIKRFHYGIMCKVSRNKTSSSFPGQMEMENFHL